VADARPWAKSAGQTQLGNTLAGLHADYMLFLLDASGGIRPAILASAESALSSCKEGSIIQPGNTNSIDGALYRACSRQRHLWRIVPISGDPGDPMHSTRVSVECSALSGSTQVDGNFLCVHNGGPCTVYFTRIGGNVMIIENATPSGFPFDSNISGNNIGGNLVCEGNTPPP
jgi:hypothetical protein